MKIGSLRHVQVILRSVVNRKLITGVVLVIRGRNLVILQETVDGTAKTKRTNYHHKVKESVELLDKFIHLTVPLFEV